MKRVVPRAIQVTMSVVVCVFALARQGVAGENPSVSTLSELQVMAKCEALESSELATVQDAPTRINTAKLVETSDGAAPYCEVEGYVAPSVGILMRLPIQWNGKFLEVGCGGFCGMYTFIWLCNAPIQKGYACITTDMGHKAKEAEGVEWAYNNPQAVIDFAYRATHVTALAGKAIARAYYGKPPVKAYFQGCSCGGRQALVEAERFPWDFDGIIVGAPAINYPEIAVGFAYRARALHDADGRPLFTASTIQFLTRAVIAKCDMDDGVKDGLIGDPRLCKFDPREYACTAGRTTDCLSREQVQAAVAYYSDVKSASGVRVSDRAVLPGSESSPLGMNDNPTMKRSFYEDFLKYMALQPNPGPTWRFENFDPDSDYKRMGIIDALLQADSPDLTRFKNAGGKMIFFHGWADGALSPLTSIEFYKTVERTMGGRSATQDFLRLFLVPDMDHCWGGRGPWSINYLDYMEAWSEHGNAPDVLIGRHYSDDGMTAAAAASGVPSLVRPIFPYPLRAQYSGSGDVNDPSNYRAVTQE